MTDKPAAARELEEALFGSAPPRCAKHPNERCLPECEYGIAGPCQREARA